MTVSTALDSTGRRRSPATLPGITPAARPRNKGLLRYPADPPTVEEIIAPHPSSSAPNELPITRAAPLRTRLASESARAPARRAAHRYAWSPPIGTGGHAHSHHFAAADSQPIHSWLQPNCSRHARERARAKQQAARAARSGWFAR